METNQNKITLEEFKERLARMSQALAKQKTQFFETIKRMKETVNKD